MSRSPSSRRCGDPIRRFFNIDIAWASSELYNWKNQLFESHHNPLRTIEVIIQIPGRAGDREIVSSANNRMDVRRVTGQLAPPRGTIEFKITDYSDRTKFFNMYDSLESLRAFEAVEVVSYPTHCVSLVKIESEGEWGVAPDDDELLLVVLGTVTAQFREGKSQVATAMAVDGEILLLPRALDYRISSEEGSPALCLHFRTRRSDEFR